jgi:hypothetical protein
MQSVKTVASMMQNLEPPTITDKDLQKKDKVFAYDPQAAFEKVKRWLIKDRPSKKSKYDPLPHFFVCHLYQLSFETQIFMFKMGLICECFDVNAEWNKTGE